MNPSDRKVKYMNENFDLIWKVVIVGDADVGKTNFLTRYAWDQFTQESRTTLGIDFACRDITHDDKKIKLQIWDTPGDERLRGFAHLYYRNVVAMVILYDITQHVTFQDVTERWLKEIKEHCNIEDHVIMLIGHKSDLKHIRSVTVLEGENLAAKYDMVFVEASAQDKTNVEESFTMLVNAVLNKQKYTQQPIPDSSPSLEPRSEPNDPSDISKCICC